MLTKQTNVDLMFIFLASILNIFNGQLIDIAKIIQYQTQKNPCVI